MRTLVADDEEPARKRMKRLLEVFPDIQIVGEATDGADALRKIGDLAPEVVFLDIEMPILNGLEVAAALNREIKVVFVTAYDDFAVKAFENNALDYLMKPVHKDRLAKTIERLRMADSAHLVLPSPLTNRVKKIGVRSGKKIAVVEISRISLIQVSGDYSEMIVDQERHLLDESLNSLSEKLSPEKFLRVHRSFIINIDFLKELKREGDRKYHALLSDYYESEAPISRDHLPKLKSILGLT